MFGLQHGMPGHRMVRPGEPGMMRPPPPGFTPPQSGLMSPTGMPRSQPGQDLSSIPGKIQVVKGLFSILG